VGALERAREDALALLEALGDPAGEVAEESVKGCQSDVAGRGLVSPVVLQMIEESKDKRRVEVINVEGRQRTLPPPPMKRSSNEKVSR
jgi:hypothetical protein